MKPLRQILVPIDLGKASSDALERAVALARTFDAAITVVHVVDVPSYAYSAMAFSVADLLTPLEEAAQTQIDAAVAAIRPTLPRIRCVVRRGVAVEEILSAIGGTKADLVVMGTHGRQGLSHAFLGSVAEKIVRVSPVPVLTVRETDDTAAGAAPRALRPIHRILAPTDFSGASTYAVDWAIDFAAVLGASVTIMHAYEYSLLGLDGGLSSGELDASQRLREAARDALRQTVESRSGRGVLVTGLLREGIAWGAIAQLAASDTETDLIVMGTHGRQGVARVLIGSVAEKVVRMSRVPTITVSLPAPAVAALRRSA